MSFSQHRTAPVDVFYSYAHEDEELCDELKKHLTSLKREGLINDWHDRLIEAGGNWEQEISAHLNTAQIILLLISANFIASDYCYGVEMKRALERHKNGEARVIPIILRPVDLKGSPFRSLQALPKDAKPVTKWDDRDEAFENIAQGIREVISNFFTPARSQNSGDGLNQNDSTGTDDVSTALTAARRPRKVHAKTFAVVVTAAVLILAGLYWQFIYAPAQRGAGNEIQYTGRVTDAETRKSIPNAKISVETDQSIPQIISTDSEGIFNVRLKESIKSARLRIEATGYNVEYRNVAIPRTGIEEIPLTSSANNPLPAPPVPTPTVAPGNSSNANKGRGKANANRGTGKRNNNVYNLLNSNGQ